ncbi:MAG: N-acetyltransferase family protein [Capnocytophaga sp.]|jgi:acetyltransferase, GNAT family|uniref:GNAT family N-acetyltransferase n=1 Tax=Capnocytophaga sp. TaxID=44737 RepID=UPI003F9F4993
MITFLKKEMITPLIEEDAHRLFALLSRRYQRTLSELFEDALHAPYVVGYIEEGRLHGMASMAIYKVISGYKGWIEDVVVDEMARGKKIGTQLIQQLIAKGKELGLGEILLFSSPTNEVAIKLYENEGFKRKGAEVFVNALKQMYPPEI